MPEPLVSIIIPVYNAAKHLDDCIGSAMAQNWPNKEIIIVDDGSADLSRAIAEKKTNKWISVYTQENLGASAARNRGLKEAKGDYIQFLDADDLLSPDKIASQMKMLDGSVEFICLCSTVHFKADEPGRLPVLTEWYDAGSNDPVDFLTKLYAGPDIFPGYGGMIQPNAWLTPRNIIDKAGHWNEALTVDDDGEFFCRVILQSKGIKFSKQGVNYYRKFEGLKSLSAKKDIQAYKSRLLAIDLKYGHLMHKLDPFLLSAIFSKYYWEIGVSTYPQFYNLSLGAIKKAKELGYSGAKYTSGKIATLLSKILGWRVIRVLSYLKYGS